jgi:hypothetical protein
MIRDRPGPIGKMHDPQYRHRLQNQGREQRKPEPVRLMIRRHITFGCPHARHQCAPATG